MLGEYEVELFRGVADTLFLSTIRSGSTTLVITDRKIKVARLFGKSDYPFDEIIKIERFKAMFFDCGIRFYLSDGKQISLATRKINEVIRVLRDLGKDIGVNY